MEMREAQELLHERKTSALFMADGPERDVFRAENAVMEREMILAERSMATPQVKVGQTRWTRPWMKGRVSQ